MYLTAYRRSGNIGDAIQTVAVMQWVENIEGYFWRETAHRLEGPQYLVNGWWGYDNQAIPKKATCVGVHCNFWTIKDSNPACFGARDHWSYYSFRSCYKSSYGWLSGCWSATFPPYNGPREGKIWARSGEPVEGFEKVSHGTWDEWGWKGTLHKAMDLLTKYQKAEEVITDRLHCALPCQGFGTNCSFSIPAGGWERFSAMDIPFGLQLICDVPTLSKPRTFEEIKELVDNIPVPGWP